jgi:hypothetical protein
VRTRPRGDALAVVGPGGSRVFFGDSCSKLERRKEERRGGEKRGGQAAVGDVSRDALALARAVGELGFGQAEGGGGVPSVDVLALEQLGGDQRGLREAACLLVGVGAGQARRAAPRGRRRTCSRRTRSRDRRAGDRAARRRARAGAGSRRRRAAPGSDGEGASCSYRAPRTRFHPPANPLRWRAPSDVSRSDPADPARRVA